MTRTSAPLDRVEPTLRAEDLAPGDRSTASGAFEDVRVHRVRAPSDPDFALAYSRLWEEFGPRGEMETRDVIAERLDWEARAFSHATLAYELLVLRRGDGTLAAVRDHTAVVRRGAGGRPTGGPVVVHLSHALVEPSQRGAGLVAWLRALPLQTARRCAAGAGLGKNAAIVLVAEMEEPLEDARDPMRSLRLRSYERAGFQKIDPATAPFVQPDFRPAEELASCAPEPIPLSLVVRRVGREGEASLPAAEVEAIVQSIYAVYAVHTDPALLDPLKAQAARWLARAPRFPLLPPTA